MTAKWLIDRPSSPSQWDDEFESDAMDPKWTRLGAAGWTRQVIDPYASFSTGNHAEDLNLKQKSWWIVQPVANYGTVGLSQGLLQTVSLPSECFIYLRGRVNQRRTGAFDGDGEIALRLGDATPAPNNHVLCMFDSFGSFVEALFARQVSGSYLNLGLVRNFFGEADPIEFIGIQKISNTYHGWAAPSSGNWIWLGSYTHSVSLSYLTLHVSNASTSSPGNAIVGVDFFRIISGRKLP